MVKVLVMTNCNYPPALEGDELGQRVYDSLRTPLITTITSSGISESTRLRLERAEAFLAARSSQPENSRELATPNTPQTYVGKTAVQDVLLPAYAAEELQV